MTNFTNPGFSSYAINYDSKNTYIYFNNKTLSDLNIKVFKYIILYIYLVSAYNNCIVLQKNIDISQAIKPFILYFFVIF